MPTGYGWLWSGKYLLVNYFSHNWKRSSHIQLQTHWPKKPLFACILRKYNFIRTDRSDITIWSSLFYLLYAFDFSLHSIAAVMIWSFSGFIIACWQIPKKKLPPLVLYQRFCLHFSKISLILKKSEFRGFKKCFFDTLLDGIFEIKRILSLQIETFKFVRKKEYAKFIQSVC